MESNLNNIIGKIDDEIIEQGMNVQSKNDFDKIKEKKFNKVFAFGGMSVALASAVLAAIILVKPASAPMNDIKAEPGFTGGNYQVTNPVHNLADDESFASYVDYEVPLLNKKIVSRNYISSSMENKGIAEVFYEDGTEFRICKDKYKDITGVYGATANGTKVIDDIYVELYYYNDINYASWYDGTYCCVYYANGELDITEVEELISKMK